MQESRQSKEEQKILSKRDFESRKRKQRKKKNKKKKSFSENYLTNDKIHFVSVLVVLCLDAYVNVTFMSCNTELSLINHFVLSCLVSLR